MNLATTIRIFAAGPAMGVWRKTTDPKEIKDYGDTSGQWVTEHGVHIFIEHGIVTKGPKALIGQTPEHKMSKSYEHSMRLKGHKLTDVSYGGKYDEDQKRLRRAKDKAYKESPEGKKRAAEEKKLYAFKKSGPQANLNLPPNEVRALTHYATGSGSTDENDAVRTGTIRPNKALDSALSKGTFPAATTVFRGMGIDAMPKLAEDPKSYIGKTITDKGYVSTSLDKSVSKGFTDMGGGVLFKISVPKGANGIYIPSHVGGNKETMISTSDTASEKEWLLPRGSSFKITGYSRGVVEAKLIS